MTKAVSAANYNSQLCIILILTTRSLSSSVSKQEAGKPVPLPAVKPTE